MGLLFFNSRHDIKQTSNEIFEVPGLQHPVAADSSHVYKRVYFSVNLLGMKVKLEYNAYDYEDDYNYMITIDKASVSTLHVKDIDIENFTTIIGNIVSSNMNIQVAREVNNELQIINPEVQNM